MIIAFCAEKRSGKDYFCQDLVEKYGATRLSFSDEVRRLAHKVFPWFPEVIPDEMKDKPFIHPNNPNGLTPRDIWLLVGKVRDVEPDYFINSFARNNLSEIHEGLNVDSKLYIITDLRTPQEWGWLKDNDIPVIKIVRQNRDGLIPDPFEEFVRNFEEYTEKFEHNMDGVRGFEIFFDRFLNKQFTNNAYYSK